MSSLALYNYMNESLPVVILERILGKKENEYSDKEEQNPACLAGLPETTHDDNSVCETLNSHDKESGFMRGKKGGGGGCNNDETDGRVAVCNIQDKA